LAGFRRVFTASIVLVCACLGWGAAIPHLDLERIDGAAFSLPEDLKAKANVLVIGFTRRAGANNEAWFERFAREFRAEPGFAAYGVAVLAGVPPLFRRFALDGVKKALTDENRGNFLVAFHDEARWKGLVGYESPDDPYILVLDGRGNELSRYRGPFSEAAYTGIEKEILRALANK
jgi:hypothetical protein